jgi:hypothetical protein
VEVLTDDHGPGSEAPDEDVLNELLRQGIDVMQGRQVVEVLQALRDVSRPPGR